MKDNRCPLHPSMGMFCACQQRRGDDAHPKFSLIEGRFEGYPIIELLKNGGQIHRHDEHFRFGVRVAQMFMAYLPAVYVFAWGSNDDRHGCQPRIFQENDRSFCVSVVMIRSFETSTREFVDKPYLRFEVLNRWEVIVASG